MSVITTTLGAAGSAGSTAAELINQMSADMLEVATFMTAPLESLFQPQDINNAKTFQWTRLERFPVSSSPTQLEEGVTPESIGITINQVVATIEQYGKTFTISDLAQLTARHDVVRETIEKIGMHMGDTRHELLYDIADAATNTFRINDRATDDAIAIGDTLSYEELVQVRGELTSNGVPRFANNHYRIVVPTQVYGALLVDPNWLAAQNGGQIGVPTDIRNGYVGMLGNMDVIESDHFSFVPTISATTGNSDSIYSCFAAGRGALGVVSLSAADKKLYLKPPGSGTDTLEQRYELGWKMTFKGVIKNNGFLRRVRASGANAQAAP